MDNNLYPNITSEEVHMGEALDEEIIIKCYESDAFQKLQEIVRKSHVYNNKIIIQ